MTAELGSLTGFSTAITLAFLPDLRDGVGSHDSGEEFGQLLENFGAQVLQEFHVCCRNLRLSLVSSSAELSCIRTWCSNVKSRSCGVTLAHSIAMSRSALTLGVYNTALTWLQSH